MAEVAHIHLDAAGGVAGDMFIAALLDALPDLRPRVFADLAAVLPPAAGRAELSEGMSGGIAVRRFGLVDCAAGAPAADHAQQHDDHHEHHEQAAHRHRDHRHEGERHAHRHAHDPAHDHLHGHHHSHHDGHPVRFPDICSLIASAPVATGTAEQAIAILRRLAEAESRMHRVPIDEVHFHEIADWDSLLDVVAAGSIAAALAGCSWSVSDLPRGGGLVRTRHGLLPIPAPATVEMLGGFAWRDDGIGGERVTPTGAAILAHLVRDVALRPAGTLLAAGSGAGSRELPGMPNVLRALAFAADGADAQAPQSENVLVVCFDIDDMSGEEIAVAADHLRAAAGVIDLTLAARSGKKGRPVSEFRLLVEPSMLAAVGNECFEQTTTLGLRWRSEQRLCLPRRDETLEAGGQTLRRKRAQRPGGENSVKVESDDLARLPTLAARRRLKQLGENDNEEESE